MSVTASDWVKGITLSVLASIIGGASKLAIRKSFLIEQALANSPSHTESAQPQDDSLQIRSKQDENNATTTTTNNKRSTPASFWLRICGMIGMTFLNPLCGVLAMTYASPSIVAPFSGLTLVWIVMFSDILIGEPPTFRQIVAASLIVFGEVIVTVFGDHTNDEGVTLDDVVQSYREPIFLAYLIGILIWMGFVSYSIVHPRSSASMRRFAWGVAGGSVTGVQNFLKDGLTILKANEGLPWYTLVFLMLAVVAAFGGLLLLMACMKRYDVTYSSAMFVGAFVVSASIMSAAHYHTFANLERPINYLFYPLGLLILMVGVFILAKDTGKDHVHGQNNNSAIVPEDSNTVSHELRQFLGLSKMSSRIESTPRSEYDLNTTANTGERRLLSTVI